MNPQHTYISQIIQNDLEASMRTYEYLTNPNRGNHISMYEMEMQFATGNGARVLKTYDYTMYAIMEMEMENKNDVCKCERCNLNEADESHTCPYKRELNDDDEECNCCHDCECLCGSEV